MIGRSRVPEPPARTSAFTGRDSTASVPGKPSIPIDFIEKFSLWRAPLQATGAAAAGEPAGDRGQQVMIPDQHLVGAYPGGTRRSTELGVGARGGTVCPGGTGECEHEERRGTRRLVPRFPGLPGIGGETATGETDRPYFHPAAGRNGRDVGRPVVADSGGQVIGRQPRCHGLRHRRSRGPGGIVGERARVAHQYHEQRGEERVDRWPAREEPPGEHRAEREHRRELMRRSEINRLRAEHERGQIDGDAHEEHRDQPPVGRQQPPGRDTAGPCHQDHAGKVQQRDRRSRPGPQPEEVSAKQRQH